MKLDNENINTVEIDKDKKVKLNRPEFPIYFSWSVRVIFNVVLIFLFILSSLICFRFAFSFGDKKINNYVEKSNLDYKILVHPNDFYENAYLDKDMIYIANLIDKVIIDFDYNFKMDVVENIDFKYNIIAELDITNSDGTNSYYTKKYDLVTDKIVKMENDNEININEKIEVDYSYYNEIANRFKNMYGVDADSKLDIYMVVSKISGDSEKIILDSENKMNIMIPLTQRAIEIKLDYNNINNVNSIVQNVNWTINNKMCLCLLILFLLLLIILFISLIKKLLLLKTKKNIYDNFINKILKEYDRLIVETTSLISFKNKEIIKVNKFSELVDTHDSLQMPINYYSINKHQKCYFYINHMNIIYLMVVKAVDLEEKSNEKERG